MGKADKPPVTLGFIVVGYKDTPASKKGAASKRKRAVLSKVYLNRDAAERFADIARKGYSVAEYDVIEVEHKLGFENFDGL